MSRPTAALAGLLLGAIAAPALKGDAHRRLDPHVHGLGALELAIDGTEVAMRFEAPAADIVGFEHAPSTEAQRAAVDQALLDLERPDALFVLPAAAGCTVREASAARVGAGEADAHGHDDHAHGGHDDDDHAHGHDHGHGHDDHAHDDHTGEVHSEFHAEYLLSCEDPAAVDRIEFAYFDRFPNALEVEATVVGPAGAQAFEATRDAPVISLRGVL
ncbi:MAG: DUF2796 domain-containing protein [Pseudomonadota bacterium]